MESMDIPIKYMLTWTAIILWMCSHQVNCQLDYYIVNDKNITSDLSYEKELLITLQKRYKVIGRNGRPVLNASRPVVVTFGLGLIQMDLDEKEKILSMSMWTRYFWKDEYMTWDPRHYGNITSVRIFPYSIWIPDIMLYNT